GTGLRTGEYDDHVGTAAEADRRLFSGENVVIAGALGLAGQCPRIRSGTGFSERQPRYDGASRHLREPHALQVGAGVACQELADLAHRVAEQLVFFGEGEIHGSPRSKVHGPKSRERDNRRQTASLPDDRLQVLLNSSCPSVIVCCLFVCRLLSLSGLCYTRAV